MKKQNSEKIQSRFTGGCLKGLLLFILALSMLAPLPGVVRADEEDDVYESMYGSVASLYSTGYGVAFDALKEGQRLEPYMDKINKIAGFAGAAGSVARKAGSGDFYNAGEETVLTIMAEVAGWDESGKVLLKYIGLSTATFQLALTAYSITKESFAQVKATKIALEIESLYGAIESDPVLKPKKGRQLGDKSDPIPVTKQSVEYVFRKVVQDASWRRRLESYVTGELGREFPKPSTWDFFEALSVGSGRAVETAEQAEVLKNRQEIETWIAGLLSRLNQYARATESEVILRKALIEIEKASKKITPEFQKFVVSADEAAKKLPEIEAYAKQLPQEIDKAKKEKKLDVLYGIRDKIGYYVRVYVRMLPDKGDIGKRKQEVKASLKQSWASASKALKDMPKILEAEFNAESSKYPTTLSFINTPLGLMGVDEAAKEIRGAKSFQAATELASGIKQEAENKLKSFQDRFAKDNPDGNNHPNYVSRWDYLNRVTKGNISKQDQDKLNKERDNYNVRRNLYWNNANYQFKMFPGAINKILAEEYARYSDTDKLKKAALDDLAAFEKRVPEFYPVTPAKNYQVTAADTRQYLNGLKNIKSEGYMGLPKMKFPKWGGFGYENGSAVTGYIEGIKRKMANESGQSYQANENYRRALEYINGLKRYLSEKDRYTQELSEIKERIAALKLQSDPKAQGVAGIEKKIQEMKDVEKLALEAEAEMNKKMADNSQKNIASIRDDIAYLDNLLRKVDYWRTAMQDVNRVGGAVNVSIVRIAVATEGSSGYNHRNYLAASKSDTNLFDKTKASAAADALLKDIQLTGIDKWDPQGDTGLKAMLVKKAEEIRGYFIDSADYAVVDDNVIYAKRIAKMASDVNSIPVSSYGTYTYKEGIKNRTFDEKLLAALRNGTAFAMGITAKMVTSDIMQKMDVSYGSVKSLASGHKNPAIRTACNDLAKAVDKQVTGFNALVDKEIKQFKIDKAKADEDMKLQNECLKKGGHYSNGKCVTTAGAGQGGLPGKPGQTAMAGMPGQQAGKGTGTPPAAQTKGAPQQGQPQAAGKQPQGSATPPSGVAQAPSSSQQAGASGKPQAPASGPSGAGQSVQSTPPGGSQQGPAKSQQPASGFGTMPQGSASQQAKTGAMGSMQQKPGATGPMASMQGKANVPPKTEDLTPKVKELYNQLKQAYESKNASGVMRCLSSQWTSSDGGSVSDLQRNLQKTFTMFDEVKFNIQNLKISKVAEKKYKASYDVTISSKIYKKNLKHEEKSSINEEVTIEPSGQPKISRTLGGKLLSVK